jgi:DnaJ-class molecular chaperone
VTFPQIWNREVLRPKWSALRQDVDGWLDFKEFTARLQLQRHHGPGTLFFVAEGGDESVLCDGTPDVAFRLVDSPGQRFERVGRWDLQTSFHGACGDGVVVGVDGREVRFEIEEGGRQVIILGEGMAKDWEGKERGDLIIDIES